MNYLFLLFLLCLLERKIPEEGGVYKTTLIVNLIRHGARTPNKIVPEFENFLPTKGKGKLTQHGFRQMVLLGKSVREKYGDFIDIKKVDEQFVLFSSPYPRAIESGIGYVLGMFPEYNYKFHSSNNEFIKSQIDLLPNNTPHGEIGKSFKFIIEDNERDVLFHSRKCKFPEGIFEDDKADKMYKHLTDDDRLLVYNYLKQNFPMTLKDISFNHFTDKLARSLFSGMQSVNFHSPNAFPIPEDIRKILLKLFVKYLFFTRTTNETITKITSTPFLQHLLNLFEHKVYGIDDKLDFHELSNFHYTDLKLVTYSGHDYNFIGLLKNFLDMDTIHHYINNIELYHKLVFIPYASSLDFHLIQNNRGHFFIKIYLNGEEIFEKLRSHEDGEHVIYDRAFGIPYPIFRKIIKSRIFKDIEKCITTKKTKVK
jgi:hypothetical protein